MMWDQIKLHCIRRLGVPNRHRVQAGWHTLGECWPFCYFHYPVISPWASHIHSSKNPLCILKLDVGPAFYPIPFSFQNKTNENDLFCLIGHRQVQTVIRTRTPIQDAVLNPRCKIASGLHLILMAGDGAFPCIR